MKPTGVPRCSISHASSSIHPQGWVPIETDLTGHSCGISVKLVAFTPKGGCPLKRRQRFGIHQVHALGSIHPQGWVPIETRWFLRYTCFSQLVAFTPKGGCPLKRVVGVGVGVVGSVGGIHPQGWVPIETVCFRPSSRRRLASGSIHPQGWVPIETQFRGSKR